MLSGWVLSSVALWSEPNGYQNYHSGPSLLDKGSARASFDRQKARSVLDGVIFTDTHMYVRVET